MSCGIKSVSPNRYCCILNHGRKTGISERKKKRWKENSRHREELQWPFGEKRALVMRGLGSFQAMKPSLGREGTRCEAQNFGLYLQA